MGNKMKFIVMAAIVAAVRIAGDDAAPAKPAAEAPAEEKKEEAAPAKAAAPKAPADPEDAWLTIPKFDLKVSDESSPPPEKWGHETQRVGHPDWLDGHVKSVEESRKLASALAGPKITAEERKAIHDS